MVPESLMVFGCFWSFSWFPVGFLHPDLILKSVILLLCFCRQTFLYGVIQWESYRPLPTFGGRSLILVLLVAAGRVG